MECLECGQQGITGHNGACNTGAGMYQIVKGGAIIDHANNERGLFQTLGEIRLELGRLAGVHVYDANAKKLSTKQVTDLLYDYAWNGAT